MAREELVRLISLQRASERSVHQIYSKLIDYTSSTTMYATVFHSNFIVSEKTNRSSVVASWIRRLEYPTVTYTKANILCNQCDHLVLQHAMVFCLKVYKQALHNLKKQDICKAFLAQFHSSPPPPRQQHF